MIEVYDEYEKQAVMINVSKIVIVYRNRSGGTEIKVEGLEYAIGVRESYEVLKYKLKGATNVR